MNDADITCYALRDAYTHETPANRTKIDIRPRTKLTLPKCWCYMPSIDTSSSQNAFLSPTVLCHSLSVQSTIENRFYHRVAD